MTRRNLWVGCAMAMVAGNKPPASTPYLAQRRDGALSLTIGCALARSLRESKVQFVVEDTWLFRQSASEQNGRLNPLRMDITTEAGVLFDNHPRLKNKALLLDITIVNPCAGSNLGNAVRHVGNHLADAVERKKNKYRGSFPATYSFLPLAMSTCGEVGSDVHAGARHQTGTAQVGDILQ